MKSRSRSERGQALILIVFAIIGLIGMTALAVDGGNIYAERRRAQNAADTSAIDAALAKVRGGNLYTEGLARAASNRYTDGDPGAASSSPEINVEIYNPPIAIPGTGDAYVGNNEYIQVIITATVRTYFGRVVGISEVTNKVQAIARAKPPIITPMAFGNAIVGLSPHDCKAIMYQGNADANVVGGGLYVNSDCDDSAFFNNSSSAQLSAPCLQAVGGITYKPGAINVPNECISSGVTTLPEIVYPDPQCTGNTTQNGENLTPGNYSGTFPPPGVTHLDSGIYCVDGNFRLNATDVLTGENVVIVMQNGDVRWNGGASIQLDAPDEGPYEGLLLFMPEDNSNEIVINGNSGSTFTGTILAPSSPITVDGTGDATGELNSQIIGYTVNISGTTVMNIFYDADKNYQAPVPPQIELVQ